MRKKIRRPLGITRLIAIGFLAVILIGTFLLVLPFSSRKGEVTPFTDALFTAASAACVTGLTVFDTYSHWNFFGQLVILSLIQIGGLGFVTVIAVFAQLLHHRVSLRERMIIRQSAGSLSIGGVTVLVKKVVAATAVFELSGAVLLALRFCPEFGFWKGLWFALFHSVSAFCNAGFDLMGVSAPGSSLTTLGSEPFVMLTLSALIICGGVGFLVWNDILNCRGVFRRLKLHSKLVLLVSGILLLSGTLFFLAADGSSAFSGLPFSEKLLNSFFCSVTVRTAGFFSLDLSTLSSASLLVMIAFMFIGGSPGSTAGGTKTTTLAILVSNVISAVRRRGNVAVFGRNISDASVRLAASVYFVYLSAIIAGTAAISLLDGAELLPALFEVTSAIGTVGLSLGLTSELCTVSKLIIVFLMYAGRVGGLSLVLVINEKRETTAIEKPTENILIG